MHTYLESVGFRHIDNRHEMNQIVRETVIHFDEKHIFQIGEKQIYGEFFKDFAENCGICVCGEFDSEGDFHPEYSFPYFIGSTVSAIQQIDIEKHAGAESYAAACDDLRIGGTIIFYLTNMGDMREAERMGISLKGKKAIRLSALAREGKILLPVQKSPEEEERYRKQQEQYMRLLSEARRGSEKAIEAVSTEDWKSFNIITRRLESEDVLSVIDSSFTPYGMECDQYSVIGNITSCDKIKNTYTGEYMYQMQIEACDLYFDLVIHADRLIGEPKPGYRFEGILWLQGYVVFDH